MVRRFVYLAVLQFISIAVTVINTLDHCLIGVYLHRVHKTFFSLQKVSHETGFTIPPLDFLFRFVSTLMFVKVLVLYIENIAVYFSYAYQVKY